MMQTLVENAAPPRLRRAGWLLVASPLGFVLWIVVLVPAMHANGLESSADLTPDVLATFRPRWLAAWPLYAAGVLMGTAGLAFVNRALRETASRQLAIMSQVAVVIATVCIVGNLILELVLTGSDHARLGLDPAYGAAMVLSYAAIWSGAIATALCGLGLRITGALRRTGLVVSVLAGLLVLADVATRGLPPFFVALLWLALGIGLLRGGVPSSD